MIIFSWGLNCTLKHAQTLNGTCAHLQAQRVSYAKRAIENAIGKCDSNRCDSQVRLTGATHKCDQQVRLTSAINRCDSQAQSLNRESKSLQVCKFASLKRLESSKVRKFALKKHKKSKKLF